MEIITSADNPFVKLAAGLKFKKSRDETGLYALEGEKFVSEAEAGLIELIIINENFYEKRGIGGVSELCKNVKVVSDKLFAKISEEKTPQGIFAAVKKNSPAFSENFLTKLDNPVFIAADAIQDPGNVGSIIRSALAAGAAGVILGEGCADVYSGKTIRAAAGAAAKIPAFEGVDLAEAAGLLRGKGYTVCAAAADGERLPYEIDFRAPCVIVVGSEGNGVSERVRAACNAAVRLPMAKGSESLNAAVAGGILLYEIVRQRL